MISSQKAKLIDVPAACNSFFLMWDYQLNPCDVLISEYVPFVSKDSRCDTLLAMMAKTGVNGVWM